MIASVGPMSGTAKRCPTRPMPVRPTARPTTAEMIGMPMATIDPNASVRMIIATTIPTSSLLSVAGVDSSEPIEPPAATSMPSGSAGFSAASRTACASSSSRSALDTSRSTGMKAVFSSSETVPVAWSPKGLGALTTSGRPWIAFAAWLIAFSLSLAVSLPESTWKTIGFWPFCWGGKRSASRSVAFWLPVPGRSTLLLVSAPTREMATTNTTRMTTHASSTHSRWAAIQRPSRYRNPAKPHPATGAASRATRYRFILS